MNKFTSSQNWSFQNPKIFILFASFFLVWQTSFAKETLKVVTSFSPLAFVVQKIAPEVILENLTNADPHKFYPSAKNIIAINNADLFIYITDSLEVWAKNLAQQRKKQTISIQGELPELFLAIQLDSSQNESKAVKLLDPHIWLDPVAMSKITILLGAEIAKLDPSQQEFYSQRAENLKNIFLQIHQQYKNILASCKKNTVIVSHDFMGYLAERYKFITYSLSGFTTLAKPSAESILKFKKLVKKEVNFILVEENTPHRFADILLQETSAQFLVIDNLAWKSEGYLSRMRQNLHQLKTALVCN